MNIYEWKIEVIKLNYFDYLLEKGLKEKKLTPKEYNKLKKDVDKKWVAIWDYYPDHNPAIAKAFKNNFI